MHGFQDYEVLLQGGYDVIVISPLGGVSHRFCWRNLKERPQFHNHGLLTHFAYLLLFRSYLTPKFQNYTFVIPKRVFLTPDRVFWAIVRENWFPGMGCSSVEEYEKKPQYPYMLPPRGVSTAHRARTNFVKVGNLPNVIYHAKFEINWYKSVPLAKGWGFMFQPYYGGRH